MTSSKTTKRILSCEDSNKRTTTRNTEKKCKSQTDPKKSTTIGNGNGKCISKSDTQKKPVVSRTCNNNAKQKTTKDKEKLPHVVKKSRMKGGTGTNSTQLNTNSCNSTNDIQFKHKPCSDINQNATNEGKYICPICMNDETEGFYWVKYSCGHCVCEECDKTMNHDSKTVECPYKCHVSNQSLSRIYKGRKNNTKWDIYVYNLEASDYLNNMEINEITLNGSLEKIKAYLDKNQSKSLNKCNLVIPQHTATYTNSLTDLLTTLKEKNIKIKEFLCNIVIKQTIQDIQDIDLNLFLPFKDTLEVLILTGADDNTTRHNTRLTNLQELYQFKKLNTFCASVKNVGYDNLNKLSTYKPSNSNPVKATENVKNAIIKKLTNQFHEFELSVYDKNNNDPIMITKLSSDIITNRNSKIKAFSRFSERYVDDYEPFDNTQNPELEITGEELDKDEVQSNNGAHAQYILDSQIVKSLASNITKLSIMQIHNVFPTTPPNYTPLSIMKVLEKQRRLGNESTIKCISITDGVDKVILNSGVFNNLNNLKEIQIYGTYEAEMSINTQYKNSITSHAGLTIEKDAFPEDLPNLIKIDIVGSKIKELNDDLLKLVNNHETYKNLKEIILSDEEEVRLMSEEAKSVVKQIRSKSISSRLPKRLPLITISPIIQGGGKRKTKRPKILKRPQSAKSLFSGKRSQNVLSIRK